LGAHPLFFVERADGWCPDDRVELAVADYGPLDDHPGEPFPKNEAPLTARFRRWYREQGAHCKWIVFEGTRSSLIPDCPARPTLGR
jgi:hypothetical protein